MEEFFLSLSTIEKTYWIIALAGSAVFIVVFLLTFLGAEGDADMEAEIDSGGADDGGVGFQFFTFKNVVAFFTIFGWTGTLCLAQGLSNMNTLAISTVAGLIMMVITSSLFYYMHKLADSGTLKISNAIGQMGEVYLPIGANRSKIGKVQIKVQGSLRELDAVTDNNADIPTNTLVKVTDVVSTEILLVELTSK